MNEDVVFATAKVVSVKMRTPGKGCLDRKIKSCELVVVVERGCVEVKATASKDDKFFEEI